MYVTLLYIQNYVVLTAYILPLPSKPTIKKRGLCFKESRQYLALPTTCLHFFSICFRHSHVRHDLISSLCVWSANLTFSMSTASDISRLLIFHVPRIKLFWQIRVDFLGVDPASYLTKSCMAWEALPVAILIPNGQA